LLLALLTFYKTGQENMADTYKQFRDINPDVIRNLIRDDNESNAQSEPTGIMAPTSSLDIADKAAIDAAVFGVIAEEIGKSSVDRNAVARAVVPTPEPKEEADLSDWESMSPINAFLEGVGEKAISDYLDDVASEPKPLRTSGTRAADSNGFMIREPEPVVTSSMYKIEKGDTISKIAKANGTTIAAILDANPDIKNPNKISIGQDIVLPSAEPEEVDITPSSTDFNSSFVAAMGASEGTKDHVDHLGIKTLGYGILPATAKKLGFDPDEEKYKDRKVLAKAVYGKMYEKAQSAYPDVFKGLTDSQKTGTLSLYINLGRLPSGVVKALSKETPDFEAAKTSLASVVLGSPRNKDGSRKKDASGNTIYTSSKGLSKRRAKEYNTLMKGSEGFKPVKTVSVEGTKAAPIFVWKDVDGKEVHRYKPSVSGAGNVYKGLDSASSMKDVTL
jgi:LysM repeat protein